MEPKIEKFFEPVILTPFQSIPWSDADYVAVSITYLHHFPPSVYLYIITYTYHSDEVKIWGFFFGVIACDFTLCADFSFPWLLHRRHLCIALLYCSGGNGNKCA